MAESHGQCVLNVFQNSCTLTFRQLWMAITVVGWIFKFCHPSVLHVYITFYM
jgi:hypothetical protein